jgi:hypothetical protein
MLIIHGEYHLQYGDNKERIKYVRDFNLEIKTINNCGKIETKGSIILYNTDDNVGSKEWVTEDSQTIEKIYFPTMTKMGILDDKNTPLKVIANFIGIYDNISDSIGRNIDLPLLTSVPYRRKNGEMSITPINVFKILSVFTAKMSVAVDIKNEWLTQYLQVLKPNTTHPLFQQFTRDSIVYSIFNPRCRTYSMRNYSYKGRNWDVKNEFFWMSKTLMMILAENNNYYRLYKDTENSDERYISKILYDNNEEGINTYSMLSPDAREILDLATNLVDISFPLRRDYEDDHLYCFDCGYEQLKRIWKKHFPEEFVIFKEKYKAFGERLRPLVYELGFLKGEPLN